MIKPQKTSSKQKDRLGIKVWGCRGSISCASKDTIGFGGNTSCYEVFHRGKDTVLVDAGTGLYPFGLDLIRRKKRDPMGKVHVLFSHIHWDHIQGIPNCPLMHLPSTEFHFYSHHPKIEALLKVLFQYTFFPVTWEEIKAQSIFHHLKPGHKVQLEGLKVDTTELKHPGGSLGFKFSQGSDSVVILTDHEVELLNPIEKDKLRKFISETSLICHDGMYTGEEISKFVGWGHSSMENVVNLFDRADQKEKQHLVLTHHLPYRSDQELSRLESDFQKQVNFKLDFAREGKTYFC